MALLVGIETKQLDVQDHIVDLLFRANLLNTKIVVDDGHDVVDGWPGAAEREDGNHRVQALVAALPPDKMDTAVVRSRPTREVQLFLFPFLRFGS
jgi:hypothetical protein